MKLRINKNSIRLRLNKMEVERFSENESITEEIVFGPASTEKLTYSLVQGAVSKITATFSHSKITVLVPTEIAENWTETDEVGFQSDQTDNDGRILKILVEKDFRCLKPREEEDESPNFPHPERENDC